MGFATLAVMILVAGTVWGGLAYFLARAWRSDRRGSGGLGGPFTRPPRS